MSPIPIAQFKSRNKRLAILASLGVGVILSTITVSNYIFSKRFRGRESRSLFDLESSYDSGSQLRYLAFTASPFSYDNYPFLLSSDTRNVALKSTSLAKASACTRSLVGDAAYDVIFLDYYFDNKKLATLAHRLRKRFPDASIVFTRIWTPTLLHYDEENTGKTKYFSEFLKDNELPGNSLETIAAVKTVDVNWKLQSLPGLDQVQDDAIEKVNGHLYKGPGADWDKVGDARDIFVYKAEFFNDHFNALSKLGHQVVAEEMKNHLEAMKPRRSDNLGAWDEDGNESCEIEATKTLSREISKLRYLKFGPLTSEDSYAHLLGSDITTIDVPINQATFCTQGLVGDKVYDVILIEYFLKSQGLDALGQRLRKRFPNATLVFLRLWQPQMLFYNDKTTGKDKYFGEWSQDAGHREKTSVLMVAFEASPEEWATHSALIESRSDAQDEAVQKAGGYLYSGPSNSWDVLEDPKEFFLEKHDLFDEHYRFSAKGNQVVAQEINELLLHIKPKRSDEVEAWDNDRCP